MMMMMTIMTLFLAFLADGLTILTGVESDVGLSGACLVWFDFDAHRDTLLLESLVWTRFCFCWLDDGFVGHCLIS